jgi:1-acyl-sn-glycerol-3-phosphate acyltransferase
LQKCGIPWPYNIPAIFLRGRQYHLRPSLNCFFEQIRSDFQDRSDILKDMPEKKDAHKQADTLIAIVRGMVSELHGDRNYTLPITLDSALDRDLGLDSLARVELLSRLEHSFQIRLSEKILAGAESLRDLLRAVIAAQSQEQIVATAIDHLVATDQLTAEAADAVTLLDVLAWHDRASPNHLHITLYPEEGIQEKISFHDLSKGAEAVASGIQHHGIEPGQTVALMLPTSRDYFYSFFGVLLAGAVPVPLYPPARPSQIEEHLRRHRGILNNSLTAMLITNQEVLPLARLLKAHVETLRSSLTVEDLCSSGGQVSRHIARPGDTAFLQYTSGSTGNPKGVVLSHANLLANIRAMGMAAQANSGDVFVSWLPLYHDMGLIGAWLGSLYYGCRLVIMSPLSFLVHPENWLWAIHRHRGTISASPNFGFELCLKRIDERDINGLDLSSWRVAFNGAEPVSPLTVTKFAERFRKYGFRPETMAPVYGLAESSVGLAFPLPASAPLIDSIERQPFMEHGKAVPASGDEAHSLRFVSCGQPLAGHRIRIVDANDSELPDRQEGRLQFCGPSATSGYYRNIEETKLLFHGKWLDSGDLAYMADGNLYITSRIKDIIIRGGRNIYPHELEEAIGEIKGIRKGCVAVFGAEDQASGTEKLVVIAETRKREREELQHLHSAVNSCVTDLLGLPPDDVLLAPPHTVLKTSSGKLRRSATRDLYAQGHMGRKGRAVWWQLVRMGLSGLLPQLRKGIKRMSELFYAGYVWGLFYALAVPVWLLVVLLPKLEWRWAVVRRASRLLVRLSGTPLVINYLAEIPTNRPMVLVSNHMSYLDAIVVIAAIPLNVSFVAKMELKERFVARWFLFRMDVEFVERFDVEQGALGTRRIARKGTKGSSLFFFAEGTFQRIPGLLPFRMGAFVTAVQSGLSVVPVTIRGTRHILTSGSWFPRLGVVTVTVSRPIKPKGANWTDAVELRDAIRHEILRYCGETDLADTRPPVRGQMNT